MKKLKRLFLVFGITFSSFIHAVEKGPLLISELPPNQIYTQQQLADFEKHTDADLKGQEITGLEKDYQLYKKVVSIRPDSLTDEQRDYLLNLTEHKPRAYKVHAEGPVAIPVYNIKVLAEYKLFKNKVAVEASKMQPLLVTNTQQFVKQSTTGSLQRLAARKAVKDSQPINESTLRQLIDAYKADGSNGSVIALNDLAELTGNKQAAMAVLKADEAHWLKRQILNNLNQYFSAQEQRTLLKELIEQKTELSSQALFAYSQLPASAYDEDLLYGLLADEVLGASSAAAIANSSHGAIDFNRLLQNIKNNSNSRTMVANSLLLLRLSGDPEAKGVLRDIVAADYIKFADIKEEVATWLE
ncbi:hypothetical protein [Kangiella shandongensis]|uniref:hypothetical protein n=1 Tax=Kangiella shandongensis TaxID=2763258 RepID=UPI001CBB92A8|nr:hypothetical protein [Kangiella shandongensis]